MHSYAMCKYFGCGSTSSNASRGRCLLVGDVQGTPYKHTVSADEVERISP
jgi:hypothetical protein